MGLYNLILNEVDILPWIWKTTLPRQLFLNRTYQNKLGIKYRAGNFYSRAYNIKSPWWQIPFFFFKKNQRLSGYYDLKMIGVEASWKTSRAAAWLPRRMLSKDDITQAV